MGHIVWSHFFPLHALFGIPALTSDEGVDIMIAFAGFAVSFIFAIANLANAEAAQADYPYPPNDRRYRADRAEKKRKARASLRYFWICAFASFTFLFFGAYALIGWTLYGVSKFLWWMVVSPLKLRRKLNKTE